MGNESATEADAGGEARERFESVIAPLDRAAFLADHWNRAPLHLAGTPGRFAHLAPWSEVNRILSSHRLPSPRLQVVRSGREIPSDRYQLARGPNQRINAGALSALLSQGATLVLAYVDEILPAVAALGDEIAAALRSQTNVNLYASWRVDNGFALHWDSHDVIVLQVSGRKHWRIHRPAYPLPLKKDRFRPPPADDPPAWEGTLEDGAMLYIPRGWAHVATPVDEPSLHLTVAVRPPNGIDFLRWLVDELGHDSALRADFPRSGTPADLESFMDRIRTHVSDGIGMGTASRFFLSWEAQQAARPLFNLPDCGSPLDGANLADAALLRLAGQRRLHSIAGDDPGEQLIIADDREWPCLPAVADRLVMLSSAADIRFGALREGLSANEARGLRTLLTGLIRVGAVFVRQ